MPRPTFASAALPSCVPSGSTRHQLPVRLDVVISTSERSDTVQLYNVHASWFQRLAFEEDNGSKIYATTGQCELRNITPTSNSRLQLFGNYASYDIYLYMCLWYNVVIACATTKYIFHVSLSILLSYCFFSC